MEKQHQKPEKREKVKKIKKVMLVKRRTWSERALIWAGKTVLILCCFALALVAGLVIGFGVLGQEDWRLVLKMETWKHIYGLVFQD